MAAFGGRQGGKGTQAPTPHKVGSKKPESGAAGPANGHGAGHVHGQKPGMTKPGGKPVC